MAEEDSLLQKVLLVSFSSVDAAQSRSTHLPRLAAQLQALQALAAPLPLPSQPAAAQPFSFDFGSLSVPSGVVPSSSSVSVPRLKVALLSSILQERLSICNSVTGCLQYLMSCYQRLVELHKNTEETATSKEVFAGVKKELCLKTKELLLEEQRRLHSGGNRSMSHSELLPLLDQCPIMFLDDLHAGCSDLEATLVFLPLLQQLSTQMQQAVRGVNLLDGGHIVYLKRLFLVSQSNAMIQMIGTVLTREVGSASTMTAREMENSFLLSPFFAMTSILSPFDKNAFNYFESLLPNSSSGQRQDVRLLQVNIQNCFKQAHECIHAVLKKLLVTKETKEGAISWLTALLQLNDARVGLLASDPLYQEMQLLLSTDGFLLNVVNVCLLFCKPFLDPKLGKVQLINPSFCQSTHRFDVTKQPKLSDLAPNAGPIGTTHFNFISEIFFVTFYALHIGFITSIGHYNNLVTMYQQTKKSVDTLKKQGGSWDQTPEGTKASTTLKRVINFLDGFETQLLDTSLLDMCAQFYNLAMIFMVHLPLDPTSKVSPEVISFMSSFPEFFVRDVAEFFMFLLRFKTDLLDLSHISRAVEWAVILLSKPTLVRNPIIRAKLANLLAELAFHGKSQQGQIGQALLYSLLGNKLLQNHSLVGLTSLYVDVDIVEGLDVDKEKFDKYNVRQSLAMLFNELWQYPDFVSSCIAEAETPLFSKFIGTVINDSIHLLEDSLGRLMDIRQLQLAMQNLDEWNSQGSEVKAEREKYYSIQENSAKGFLTLALAVLDLLAKLTNEKQTLKQFMEPVMLTRVAAMLVHFFDTLAGPKCNNLKVNNPEKYNFSPKDLLMKITKICMNFVSSKNFVEAMANDMDYSHEIMKKVLYFLNRERIVPEEHCKILEVFIAQVESHLMLPEEMGDGKAEVQPMDLVEQSLDSEEWAKSYVDQLKDEVFDTCDMKIAGTESNKYDHHYATNIATTGSVASSKMVRLSKECQTLATSLPISPSSSIFVRADEERLDVMKAIITGPAGTPYSLGCFTFDIYFPHDYPVVPPLVNLEITGNGTVRFNPNLYNCGKVCLSLLGTWHGDNQLTKWNPGSSSLYQVLVSIQAFILVEEPYFNEPAYEAQRGTKEGTSRSAEYNENIWVGTLRHAIIGQLRNPTKGFETVIQSHFRLHKHNLRKQAEQWVLEASDTNRAKLERALHDLNKELNKL